MDYKEKVIALLKSQELSKEQKEKLEEIFPELKESEDEKIRKALLEMVHDTTCDELWVDYDVHKEEALAWLEKQGEITKEWSEMKFNNIQRELQEMVDLKQKTEQGEQNTNHKNMIVKFICKKDWHGIGDYYYGKIYNGYPCEKEQKGYDIYDDNHIPTFCDEDFINEYFTIIEEKQVEQNPYGQRKESEDERTWIINYLSNRELNSSIIAEKENLKKAIAWLQRQGEQKQEWSEEDDYNLQCCIAKVQNDIDNGRIGRNRELLTWLKSLKDRIQPQPKQEWSQNDIDMIDWLIRCCEKEHGELCNDKYGHQDIVSDLKKDCRKKWNWLESLKNKVVPQNRWKPSDEQMKALNTMNITGCITEVGQGKSLIELYNDLKKLMEE